MTTQITVRLPDDVLAYVDGLVAAGVGSRAAVVTRALNLYRQQLVGEDDARILESSGDYDEFDALTAFASIES